MAKKFHKLTTDLPLDSISWEDLKESFLYLKKINGLSDRTTQDYQYHITKFFALYPTAWSSEAELTDNLLEYFSLDTGAVNFNHRLVYLRAFLSYAVEEGYLSENPLSKIKKRKEQSRIVEIPTEVLQDLLKLPNKRTYSGLRDYTLILLSLDSGIRPSEALGLLLKDIDTKHYTITVPFNIAKTRTTRTLPLSATTVNALNRLIRVRPTGWSSSSPVFCSCEGSRLLENSWKNRLRTYSMQLDFKVRPYDLRHQFSIMYLRNNGNVFALQKTLGHSDLSMTKRYLNITGQDLTEAHKTASPVTNLVTSINKTRMRNL